VHEVDVAFHPDDAHNFAALGATRSVHVNKVLPEIRWRPPDYADYNALLSVEYLNAAAWDGEKACPGELSYEPPLGARWDEVGDWTLTARFVPAEAVEHYYLCASACARIYVRKALPQVCVTPPSLSAGDALCFSSFETVASYLGEVVPGAVEYWVQGDGEEGEEAEVFSEECYEKELLLCAGQKNVLAKFRPEDARHFHAVETTLLLSVNRRQLELDWTDGPAIPYGMPLSERIPRCGESSSTTRPRAPSLSGSVGLHELRLLFSPADSANFEAVERTVALLVEPLCPEVVFRRAALARSRWRS
jgi:hypothetical protein